MENSLHDLLAPHYITEEYGGYRKFKAPYAIIQEVANREGLDLHTVPNPPAPSFGEFLELLRPLADKVIFEGYRIFPPRSDTAVVLEGFRYQGPMNSYIWNSVLPRVQTADVLRWTSQGMRVWYD